VIAPWRCVDERRSNVISTEAGQPVGIGCEGVGKDLQRDLAVELRVGGLPDLPHPALANEGSDLVEAEAGAARQRHAGSPAADYTPDALSGCDFCDSRPLRVGAGTGATLRQERLDEARRCSRSCSARVDWPRTFATERSYCEITGFATIDPSPYSGTFRW